MENVKSENDYRKCAKCGRTRAQDKLVTYHRFPNPGKNNETKALAWATYCWPNEAWTYASLLSLHTTYKVLCGRHFSLSQFYDNKRLKLSKFAVPDSSEVEQLLKERDNVFEQNTLINVISDVAPRAESVSRKHSILGSIHVKNLNKLTSREKTLYNVCRRKLREIIRLRNKLKNRKVNFIKKISENENVKKLCDLKISNSFIVLLQSQLKNCPKKPNGRRYTLQQKIMALVIYKKSPACYGC
ncbi:hypothetical protein ACJJTC_004439 [Scirpophaga incertulas]